MNLILLLCKQNVNMNESFQLDDLEIFEIEQAAVVPNSDDISNCSCRGMCLRDSGRSECPCKSVGHYCSSACHANQFSEACMNHRKVLESDSDNSEDNKSDNSDVSMRPVSEL